MIATARKSPAADLFPNLFCVVLLKHGQPVDQLGAGHTEASAWRRANLFNDGCGPESAAIVRPIQIRVLAPKGGAA